MESKRIFGIIPNNRTWPSLTDYKPLSPKQKFEIARQDSFDRGTVILAAAFAGYGQLTNANRSFGQGRLGYARYFGASYGDFVIGNYMSEAIFPTLLHQDPRYFRRGIGSGWSRLAIATGQIFWTHTDSDRTQFNYSEILGNSDRGRDFKRLLPGQPERRQFGTKARPADRRRYGLERLEGILARYQQKVFQEDSSIILAGDPELAQHGIQRSARHSQTVSRGADHAIGLSKNADDVFAFHFRECAPGAFHRFGAQFRERSTEQGPLGKNDRSLKEVLEFPYIPGPRPAHQGLHYVRWHLVNPLVHFVRVFFGEVPDQYRYVRGMVAQPGRGDRKDFQAIV